MVRRRPEWHHNLYYRLYYLSVKNAMKYSYLGTFHGNEKITSSIQEFWSSNRNHINRKYDGEREKNIPPTFRRM